MPGPAPKRSTERRRTNKVDIDHVEIDEQVKVPPLGMADAHPMARDFYNSLRRSGQARYFEPSDWQRARLMAWSLSKMLQSGRPSAMLLAALQKDMDALLVSEAERRRVRMEIDRTGGDTSADDAKVAQMERYRRAASSGAG